MHACMYRICMAKSVASVRVYVWMISWSLGAAVDGTSATVTIDNVVATRPPPPRYFFLVYLKLFLVFFIPFLFSPLPSAFSLLLRVQSNACVGRLGYIPGRAKPVFGTYRQNRKMERRDSMRRIHTSVLDRRRHRHRRCRRMFLCRCRSSRASHTRYTIVHSRNGSAGEQNVGNRCVVYERQHLYMYTLIRILPRRQKEYAGNRDTKREEERNKNLPRGQRGRGDYRKAGVILHWCASTSDFMCVSSHGQRVLDYSLQIL